MVISLSICYLHAVTTNRTFISPSLWQQKIARVANEEYALDVTFHVQKTNNKNALGKAIGFKDQNNLLFQFVPTKQNAHHDRYFLHYPTAFDYSLRLRPERHEYGVNFSMQKKLFDGKLILDVGAPLLFISHRLNPNFSATLLDPRFVGGENALKNYFFGEAITYPTLLVGNPLLQTFRQDKLQNLLMYRRRDSTQLADITSRLWFQCIDTDFSKGFLGLGVIAPMSPRSKSRYLFEPLSGTHGHGGMELLWQSRHTLFSRGIYEVGMRFNASLRWLFARDEKRTLGIKGRNYGHYILLGKRGGHSFIPAANILTKNFEIKQGLQFQSSAQVYIERGAWRLNFSHTLLRQERERGKLREKFKEDTYAIAHVRADSTFIFGNDPADFDTYDQDWLSRNDLDTSSLFSPSALLSRITTEMSREWTMFGGDFEMHIQAWSDLFCSRLLPSSIGVSVGINARI